MVSVSCAVFAARAVPRAPSASRSPTRLAAARDGDASASSSSSSAVPSPPPRRDYASLFARGAEGGCPPLFLAPMEGLGDRRLRRALARSTGGFDEACREFTRVPGALSQGAKPEKLLRGIALNGYAADELLLLGDDAEDTHLLAAQLMGSNPELLERCARILATEGNAPRVDLNCGCPANVVTGKGAGSSLLRDPAAVYASVAAVARGVAGTGCAVTLKLRSGYDDRGLLRENLLAAQAGGAQFVTLHPRTRREGYTGNARWEDIAFAVDLLDVPVVGNGDVTSPAKAFELLERTNCAGVMIGRGAVQDPLIFRRIKAAFAARRRDSSGESSEEKKKAETERDGAFLFEGDEDEDEHEPATITRFLRAFAAEAFAGEALPGTRVRASKRLSASDLEKFKLGKLKQVCKYLFAANPGLTPYLAEVLTADADAGADAEATLARIERLVEAHWRPPEDVLVDAFSMRAGYERGMRDGGKAVQSTFVAAKSRTGEE